MAISDDLLNNRFNRHFLISAKEKINDSISKFLEAGGKSWWVLIIDYGENRYGLLWLFDLAKQFGLLGSGQHDWNGSLSYDEQIQFWLGCDKLLTSIKPSAILKTVERNDFSDQDAWLIAEQSPGRVLVVLENGQFVGIVNNRKVDHF